MSTKYLEYISSYNEVNRNLRFNKKTRLENILYALSIRSKVRLDSPTIVGLDITSMCNLRCKHCFIGERYMDNELSTEEIKNLLTQVKNMGTYQIYIMGGEPFCRRDLLEIVRYIKYLNMTISINTNALMISKEDCDELASLLDPDTDWLQISLDGACAETNDYIRNSRVFHKVIEKIKMMTTSGITTRVNTVVTRSNIGELHEIYRLCYELGVKRINFNPLYPYKGDNYKLQVPSNDEYIEAFEKVLEVHEALEQPLYIQQDPICIPFSVDLFRDFFTKNLDKSPVTNCRAGLYSFELDPVGNVFPCTFMHHKQFCAGNIREESIEKIWRDDSRWTTILSKKYGDTYCSGCTFVDKCKGGCIAAAYDYYGNINQNDPRCSLCHSNL